MLWDGSPGDRYWRNVVSACEIPQRFDPFLHFVMTTNIWGNVKQPQYFSLLVWISPT